MFRLMCFFGLLATFYCGYQTMVTPTWYGLGVTLYWSLFTMGVAALEVNKQ